MDRWIFQFTDIIRQFSPSLKGASAKTSENEDSFDADLNVAFLGASARFVIKNKYLVPYYRKLTMHFDNGKKLSYKKLMLPIMHHRTPNAIKFCCTCVYMKLTQNLWGDPAVRGQTAMEILRIKAEEDSYHHRETNQYKVN